MHKITLDAEAGQVSAELARRGIAAGTRVHVLVEVMGEPADASPLPMAAIAQAGGAFDWLAEEPDLYTDADLVQPLPQRAGQVFAFGSIVLTQFPFTDFHRSRPPGTGCCFHVALDAAIFPI